MRGVLSGLSVAMLAVMGVQAQVRSNPDWIVRINPERVVALYPAAAPELPPLPGEAGEDQC